MWWIDSDGMHRNLTLCLLNCFVKHVNILVSFLHLEVAQMMKMRTYLYYIVWLLMACKARSQSISRPDIELLFQNNVARRWSVQDCSNSIANALELLQSYTKPSISCCCIVEYCIFLSNVGVSCSNQHQGRQEVARLLDMIYIYIYTVETLYSTIYYSKYFIELNFDKSTQYVALWTHKRHPIPRPFGRAMECLLWVFQQKLTVL